MPKDVRWPGTKSTPPQFLLQINLTDAARLLPASHLPKSGLLSFFIDVEQLSSSPEQKEKGGWKVLFHDVDPASVVRAALPETLNPDALAPECALTFAKVDSIPDLNSPILSPLEFTQAEKDRYAKLLRELQSSEKNELPINKLLGYPDTIQDDMVVELTTTGSHQRKQSVRNDNSWTPIHVWNSNGSTPAGYTFGSARTI